MALPGMRNTGREKVGGGGGGETKDTYQVARVSSAAFALLIDLVTEIGQKTHTRLLQFHQQLLPASSIWLLRLDNSCPSMVV